MLFLCVKGLKEEPAELPYRGPLIRVSSNGRREKKNSSCNECGRVKVLFFGRLCGFGKGLENQLWQSLFITWIMKGHEINKASPVKGLCISPVLSKPCEVSSDCTESVFHPSAHSFHGCNA